MTAPDRARLWLHVMHAIGCLLGAWTFVFLTWLQIQLIGPRWESVTLILALIVFGLLYRAWYEVRQAICLSGAAAHEPDDQAG